MCPAVSNMILPLCLSLICNKKPTREYAAMDFTKLDRACWKAWEFSSPYTLMKYSYIPVSVLRPSWSRDLALGTHSITPHWNIQNKFLTDHYIFESTHTVVIKWKFFTMYIHKKIYVITQTENKKNRVTLQFIPRHQTIINFYPISIILTPGEVATTRYGKRNKSSPTVWKMFLKMEITWRASMSCRTSSPTY